MRNRNVNFSITVRYGTSHTQVTIPAASLTPVGVLFILLHMYAVNQIFDTYWSINLHTYARQFARNTCVVLLHLGLSEYTSWNTLRSIILCVRI
jgi:hypothetical protein